MFCNKKLVVMMVVKGVMVVMMVLVMVSNIGDGVSMMV
jgi:hypothetical protein